MLDELQRHLQDYLHHEVHLTKNITVRPIDFKLEFAVLAVALFYILLHANGKRRNRAYADTWVREALPAIEREFATTAKDGQGKGELLLWNGGDEAVLYASGRRSVER